MSDIVHVIKAQINPNSAPTRSGQHWINETTKQTWLSVGTATVGDWILVDDSPTVKISAADTTADYLGSKLSAGTGIILTTLNPGADETIQISSPGSTTDENVKVSAADTTPGYLNTELTVSNGTNATNPLEKSITSPGADEKLNLQFDQTKLSITASQVSNFNEAAQDAVGTILTDTATIDFTYNDAGNQITADLKNTTVTAAAYGSATQVPSYTVDAQGRLTTASNVSIQITESQVTNLTTDLAGKVPTTRTVSAGSGLAGGGALSSDITLSLATIGAGTILSNITGANAVPVANTLTSIIDNATSTTQGSILYRNASGWVALSPGTSGQVLGSGGPAANPAWISNTAGSVTSVGLSLPSIFSVTGSPVTSSGTLTGTFNTQSANLVFAGPSTGIPATPTFRSLVAGDIPALAYVTSIATGTGLTGGPITSSGTISIANTSVTASSYGSASQVGTFTVNAQGQLTAAANTAISIASSAVTDFSEAVDDRVAALAIAGTGITITYNDPANTLTFASTITQYTDEQAQDTVATLIQNGTGISWSYNDTLNTLTPTVSLSPFSTTNLAEGTNLYFTNGRAQAAISVTDTASLDLTYTAGNISGAVLPAGVNHNLLQNYVANEHINHSAVSLIAGTGISATGLGDLTASRTINLANTAVTASSYGSATQVATFTVNAQGQLTAAANTAIAITSSAVSDFSEAAQDAIGAALTDTASIDFTYSDAGNTISAAVLPAGVNHDLLQNFVANEHIDHSTVSISAGTGLTGGGDITTNRTISMPNVGTAGTYGSASQVPVFTTDAQGRVTSVTNTTISATVSITAGQVGFGSPGSTLTSDSDLFWDNTNKRLGIGTNAPETQLHLADDTGQNQIFEQANNTLSESAFFEYRKAKGTLAFKLAVAANDKLGGFGGFGWDGSAYQFAGEQLFYAEAAFTGSSSPGYWIVSTTPVGSTSPVERLRINSSGLGIWGSAIRLGDTTDTTDGNIRFTGSEFQIRESATWKPIAQTPDSFTSTTAQNSTSATFAALSSITTTPAAGSYKVDFTASAQISASTSVGEWAVFVNGVEQTVTRRRMASVSTTTIQNSIAISTLVTVSGSQVVEVRFRRVSGTGTITTTERQMILTPYAR